MAESFVRGYCVYREMWLQVAGEVLVRTREPGDHEDPYAVANSR